MRYNPSCNNLNYNKMIHKEDYQDAVEYHNQPSRIFKTFTATLYESDQVTQDVIVYPLHLDGDVLDVEVKMMILIKPQSIRDDISETLRQEYGLILGNLKFSMSPKEYSI